MRAILSVIAVLVALLPGLASAQLFPGALDQLSPEAKRDHALVQELFEATEWEAALAPAARVLAEATERLGPGHGTTIELSVTYGRLLDNLDRQEEALAHFEALYAQVQ